MSVSTQKAIETLADTILQVVDDKLNKMNRDLLARITKLEGSEAQNEVYIGVGQPNAEAKIWIDTTDLYPPADEDEPEDGTGESGNTGEETDADNESGDEDTENV